MDQLSTPQLIAVAAGLGWGSGLRLYAVLFLTGLAGALGWVPLPHGLHLLQTMPLLIATGFMVFVEFFADKIPWADSLWDAVHTVLRIPAGALLAASVFGWDHATTAAMAALMGGTLAATAHAAKASTRAAVNVSPEPVSNLALSLAGDVGVPAMLWLSWSHPLVFAVVLALSVVLALWLVATLFRFLRALWARGLRSRGRSIDSV
jgi:hypothetical protein